MVEQTMASGSLIVLGVSDSDVFATRLNRMQGPSERVIIIDPKPEISLPQGLQVEHVKAALAKADGEAEMTVYSIVGLRSFSPPTEALKDIFPGLRDLHKKMVPVISVSSLLEQLGPLDGPLRFWIDMPGEEASLLDTLQEAGLLERAEDLVIRCGVESFFEAAEDCATLKNRLAREAFDLVETDERDPDWPDLRLRANAALRRLNRLEAELPKAEKALAAARAESAARDEEIAEKTEALARLRVQSEEQDQALAARDKEMAALAKKEADLGDMVSKLKAGLEAAEKKTEAARSDLAFQMRLKEMQALDLDNLRQRFEDSEQRRRQQEELFLKLTPRLSQASEQLRRLQLTADSDAYAVTSEEVSEVRVGGPSKPKSSHKKKAKRKSPSKSSQKA